MAEQDRFYTVRNLPVTENEADVDCVIRGLSREEIFLYIQVGGEVIFLGKSPDLSNVIAEGRSISTRAIIVIPSYDQQQVADAERGLSEQGIEEYVLRRFDDEVYVLGKDPVTKAVIISLESKGYKNRSKTLQRRPRK